jgi:predicted nucleic acid-binding protein
VSWRLRAHSRRVFIDSSAYFALVDAGDANHAVAQAVTRRLQATRRPLFTTNFVVAETHGLVLSRLGRSVAAKTLREIDLSAATKVRVSSRDEARAREIIERYDDKGFSLTDTTSFAVMERLWVVYAFTFDHHFEQFGFQMIRAGTDD